MVSTKIMKMLKQLFFGFLFSISTEIQLQAADPKAGRMPNENLRTFLMTQLSGILKGCQPKTIHQLCDLYEKARFSPDGFTSNNLEMYRELVANLVQM